MSAVLQQKEQANNKTPSTKLNKSIQKKPGSKSQLPAANMERSLYQFAEVHNKEVEATQTIDKHFNSL
jgi:hypothetical protein